MFRVYEWTDTISPWQPSGVYTYHDISVQNEADLTSEPWHDVGFAVANTKTARAPTIESVALSTDQLNDGGSVQVTVTALSNAPVDWIERSLFAPDNKNLYGGGHGATFLEVGNDL